VPLKIDVLNDDAGGEDNLEITLIDESQYLYNIIKTQNEYEVNNE
jgi:hypothetical protein